jgi:hypothetical protein
MKNFLISSLIISLLGACSWLSGADGQTIYHWERPNTGVEKFSRDHTACMRESEPFKIMPRFQTLFYDIFYSEEKKLEIRADWESETGIWASYVPYPGAEPVIINNLRDDDDNRPLKYSACMKNRGYVTRNHSIPVITNINVHKNHLPNRRTEGR